jgi:hypothetical protein
MLKRIFSNIALTALLALGAIGLPAVAQNERTSANCMGSGEAMVDGVCRQVRMHSEVVEMFVPKDIKTGAGPSAYYLTPTTQNSSWDRCTSGIGLQDSTCVVPYVYRPAAGLATISASFTDVNPLLGGSGTSPQWTTTGADSLAVTCSGVASYNAANAPVQATPSGINFNSAVAGPVTCNFTALNSDREPSTATITAMFTPPPPPSITASFSRLSPRLGGTGTSPSWTTANAVSLNVNCTGVANYYDGNAALQASPSGVNLNSANAGDVSCVLTATNQNNESTTATINATFVAPALPTIAAGFSRPSFDVGTGGTEIIWNSTNAETVYVSCSGFDWGPGFVGLQGNPSGVRMDRDTTGNISCTFTATNLIGQTATATTTASVVRPPPPSVGGYYNPSNITAGQQSQLIYSSANAVSLGLVCNGLEFTAVRDPSLLLNRSWYFFTQTWPDPGTQECGIAAHNSLGEISYEYFSLVVAPAGNTASGGGPTGANLYPIGTPGVPSGGNSGGSGKPVGYYNPATGQLSSDPAGLNICTGNCSGGPDGPATNTTATPPTPTPATGGGDGDGNGGDGNG